MLSDLAHDYNSRLCHRPFWSRHSFFQD